MNGPSQIPDVQTTKTENADRQWWTRLPSGEKAVIRAVFRLLGIAKRNQSRDIAQAAVKWERSLGCFIKVRLTNQKPRR